MNTHRSDIHDSTAMLAPACIIRRGLPADANALSVLAARTFADTYGRYNRPEDLHLHLTTSYGLPQQMRELSDPDVITLLACCGEQLAGFAQVRRGPAPACVTGEAPVELYRFYVDAPWHGRGVGQLLLAQARDAAIALGGATFWLKVWARNSRAMAFYTKESFVDVGTADFFVGSDRQTDRVLAMALTHS